MKLKIAVAVGFVVVCGLAATADESQTEAKKPPYERLLQGDDAKLAEELNQQIKEAEEADEYDKALELTKELLGRRMKVQGDDHWETVNVRWELDARRKLAALPSETRAGWRKARQGFSDASQKIDKGRYADAAPLLQEYNRWCVQVFGEKHVRTAGSYVWLAQNLNAQARYADAQPLYQKALDLFRDLVGEKHPYTATCRSELATILYALGKYVDAQAILKAVLDIRIAVLGDKHPDTVDSYSNLAVNLMTQGKYADAVPLLKTVLDLRVELAGEKDPDTARSYSNLAASLDKQEKYAEALPLHKRALDLRVELYGEKHPEVAISYLNLAGNLKEQGKSADAEPLFQKAIDLNVELLGEKHPTTATSINAMAANLNDRGKFADAQIHFQKALALYRELFGEKHPKTAQGYNNLAFNLSAQGKYADAYVFYQQALDLRRELLGDKHPDIAVTYNNLAANLDNQRKYADAQPLYRKALDLNIELFGEKNRFAATCYNNLAANLGDQRNHADAEVLYRRALDLRLELLGEKHPETASSYNILAANLDDQRKHADAEVLDRKALSLRLVMLGEKHPDTANSYRGLGYNLIAQKKFVDAQSLLECAAASYEAARLKVAGRGLDRAIYGAKQSPYGLLAVTKAELRAVDEAWAAAETDLARGLSDEMAFHLGTTHTVDELNQKIQLTLRLDQLQPRILQAVSIQSPTDSEQGELARLQAERTTVEARLAELAANLSQREVATLAQVQNAIAAESALVLWLDEIDSGGSVNEHWGCVVRRTGEPSWERLAGTGSDGKWTDDDNALPSQLRSALASGTVSQSDVASLAQQLYAQRLVPLAKHLAGIKTLHIAGVNAMAGIPIEVLTRDFTISYVPSGTFLVRLSQRDPASKSGLLALADPVFNRPEEPSQANQSGDLPSGGLLVTMVAPGGAAARAQLKPGDVLVRYGEIDLNSIEQLTAAIQTGATLEEIPITVWRGGEQQPFTRNVPPGRLGVGLNPEPARKAIAGRRKNDAILAALRGGDWKELPGTRVELTQLAKLFGGQITSLLASAASEQSLDDMRKQGDLSKFRYLHFATHGKTNNVKAFESVLILAQDKLPNDPLPRAGEPFINGQLSANEVLEFWELNADLVTLSACETALGRKGGGDGLLGFAQAFLTKGSRAVCLSLWKVDDTATALLMTRFYQNLLGKRDGLKGPMGKAKALAEAKEWLRELSAEEADKLMNAAQKGVERPDRGKGESLNPVVPPTAPTPAADKGNKPFSHPRFWSAFILIGDPN